MKQIAFLLVGVLLGFILAGAVFIVTRLPSGTPVALAPAPTKVPIAVQVLGGVVRPGVYELPEGSRVQDAIDAAGGLVTGADTSAINLAAKVDDGSQIDIPGGDSSVVPGANPDINGNPGGLPFSVVPSAAAPTSSASLININTATLAELESLPSIGPTSAQNILDYRAQHGPFSQIEDIMNVPGIGPATFDTIQELITVGQ